MSLFQKIKCWFITLFFKNKIKNLENGIWKIWDFNNEEWVEWSNKIPLAKPLEFLHQKHVGNLTLYIYRDIKGNTIGKFFRHI